MHIVATTIAVPVFLDSYRQNLERYGHLRDTRIWVVADRKTPPQSAEYAAEQRKRGLDVVYLDPASQQRWLEPYPDLAAIIPWNSDNRRNIGFLRALEEGCKVLVSIDDDNFCIPESDFYAGHQFTGARVWREVIQSENGWYNICDELILDPPARAVARGFPHAMRNGSVRSRAMETIPVVAKAGLWLGDPDVDAATRLAFPLKATDTRRREIALDLGTWSPINTQNTSVARRAIPAYYYVRMLEDLPGARLDRYGDIWSGYFLTRCAQHLGEYIGIGSPVVSHLRNSHDLLAELRAEIWGMIVTPHLIELLRTAELSGGDYSSAARSLARALRSRADDLESCVRLPGVGNYVRRIGQYLDTWVDVCEHIGSLDGTRRG